MNSSGSVGGCGKTRSGNERCCVAAALACVLCAAPAFAQSGEPADGDGAPAAEMVLFQEIDSVFGASKYEQKPIEAPSSVTVVTADEIREHGYRTVSEVLRNVRGFFVTDDRSYMYAGVRGFSRPEDYNSRILVLLDGHRLNEGLYDSVLLGTAFHIDLEIVDRIEIVRGPGSSLYGTSAVFAVINVVTKRGRALKGADVAAQAGSFDSWRGRASWGDRLANGTEVMVSASAYESDGPDLFFPLYATEEEDGWVEGLDDDKTQKLFVKIARGDFTLEGAFSDRHSGAPTAAYGADFGTPLPLYDTSGAVFLGWSRDLADGARIEGRASYNHYAYEGDWSYGGIVNRDVGRNAWWGVEGNWVRPIGGRNKVVAGGEFRDNFRLVQTNYDVDPYWSYLDSRESNRIWAVFAQDEVRVGERFLVNAGLRYDHYDSFGGTLNPRAALIWRFGEETAAKLLVGRAFRAPNSYELYYYDSFSQEPNPDLEPEILDSAEGVLESAFGRFRATGSLYHYRIRDLINAVENPESGNFYFSNVGRVHATGLEAEIQGSLASRLDGRISWAVQKSEVIDTGEELTNSPRHVAQASFSSPLVREVLTAALDLQYMSSVLLAEGGSEPGHLVANLTLKTRPWRNALEIGATVYNLADEDYAYPGTEVLGGTVPQNGRTWTFGLRYEF